MKQQKKHKAPEVVSQNAALHEDVALRERNGAKERIVLVGTYKGDQLTKWRRWYNYPISDDDKIGATPGDIFENTEAA